MRFIREIRELVTTVLWGLGRSDAAPERRGRTNVRLPGGGDINPKSNSDSRAKANCEFRNQPTVSNIPESKQFKKNTFETDPSQGGKKTTASWSVAAKRYKQFFTQTLKILVFQADKIFGTAWPILIVYVLYIAAISGFILKDNGIHIAFWRGIELPNNGALRSYYSSEADGVPDYFSLSEYLYSSEFWVQISPVFWAQIIGAGFLLQAFALKEFREPAADPSIDVAPEWYVTFLFFLSAPTLAIAYAFEIHPDFFIQADVGTATQALPRYPRYESLLDAYLALFL